VAEETILFRDEILSACNASISQNEWAWEHVIEGAQSAVRLAERSESSLALHIQAMNQGSCMLAEAEGDVLPARSDIAYLKHYFAPLHKKENGDDLC